MGECYFMCQLGHTYGQHTQRCMAVQTWAMLTHRLPSRRSRPVTWSSRAGEFPILYQFWCTSMSEMRAAKFALLGAKKALQLIIAARSRDTDTPANPLKMSFSNVSLIYCYVFGDGSNLAVAPSQANVYKSKFIFDFSQFLCQMRYVCVWCVWPTGNDQLNNIELWLRVACQRHQNWINPGEHIAH